MDRIVSFHPVDVSFFDDTLAPLLAGDSGDTNGFVTDALRLRAIAWHARRIPRALERIRSGAGPARAKPGDGLLRRLRLRLEEFDYRPDDLTRRVLDRLDPDLHVQGRPFFIVDGAVEKVADLVDAYRTVTEPLGAEVIARGQLGRLDPTMPGRVPLDEDGPPPSGHEGRADLHAAVRQLTDLTRAAREKRTWSRDDGPVESALTVLCEEMPWRAAVLASRVVPFWTARNVEGLESLCRAVGVEAPAFLVPPVRLFTGAVGEFPPLKEALTGEMRSPRDLGGFVTPDEVPALLEFIAREGGRIVAAATRQGEAAAVSTYLRKMKECATYAARHGLGTLEASGVPQLEPEPDPVGIAG